MNKRNENKGDQDLVTVASFIDYLQANVAKTKVESQGIECWSASDMIVTIDWIYSFVYGGANPRLTSESSGRYSIAKTAPKMPLFLSAS